MAKLNKEEIIKSLECPKCGNKEEFFESVLEEDWRYFKIIDGEIYYEGSDGEPAMTEGLGIYCEKCLGEDGRLVRVSDLDFLPCNLY